jgi:hypothetical protein
VLLSREGTTPARLRTLKEAIPPARKITKTDLAKYLNAWDQKPHIVSLGAQKNFERFMQAISEQEESGQRAPIDAGAYKLMVAKAILYKRATAIVRPIVPAFQANVTAYLIALIASEKGSELKFQRIWDNQSVSEELVAFLAARALEVHSVLQKSAAGRMISEWAKKAECWDEVRSASYPPWPSGLPEFQQGIN